jgi:integrase
LQPKIPRPHNTSAVISIPGKELHINQVSCALRFFFGVTLGRQDAAVRIVTAKEPKKLPVVLSVDEIARFLEAIPDLRNRAALTTAYGAETPKTPHITAMG